MAFDRKRLVQAIAIAAGFAVLGAALAGDDLAAWFERTEQPRFSLPLWGWGVVGALYYTLTTTVLYRVLSREPGTVRTTALRLVLVLMAYNELWNLVLFGPAGPQVALWSLLPFVAYVVGVVIYLLRRDVVAGWLLAPYALWLAYDLYWTWGLLQLN